MGNRYIGLGVSAIGFAALLAPPALAQEVDRIDYDLPEQALSASVRDIGTRARIGIIAPAALLEGKTAPPLTGRYTARGAVEALLRGTGLQVSETSDFLIISALSQGAGRVAGSGGRGPVVGSEAPDPEVVVTGTRIRGRAPVGADVTTIDRRDIEQSGYATAQELLRSLPQNFNGGPGEATAGVSVRNGASDNVNYGSGINLRGLGASSTLVLLNGARPPLGGFSGAFTDLSLIPLSAIERIEVLADGASALYGSDAVAGVVNLIPRTRFEGLEVSLGAGTADGDFSELRASAILGRRWSSGRVILSYEYYERGNLSASQRDFATDDLRPFGGPDYRNTYASPGTIVAGGRSFAIPDGQDGRALRREQLLPGVNRGDSWAGTDLLPRQLRHAAYAHAEQSLGRVTAFTDMLVAERRYIRIDRPTFSGRRVPVTNPFYVDPIGTRQPVTVQYHFARDLGLERDSGRVRALGLAGGLTANFGAWAAEVRGTYGIQQERSLGENLVNSARLTLALADTNPATAFNLFGSGGSNNPETIAKVRGSSRSFYRYGLWSVTAKADGPLFALPAGDVRVAFGGEYREERFASRSISDVSALLPVEDRTPFPNPRRIVAGYAELSVPIVSAANRIGGFERLDLSLAGRIERYRDFGTTRNPKIGISWSPLRGAVLRGTYGTSFRAPGFANLRQGPNSNLYFAIPLPDGAAPGGVTNALVLRGNQPELGPERATTWTAGFDLAPAFLPGLRLEATWFRTRYRDRITDPSSELFSFLRRRDVYGALITNNPPTATVASYYASPFFRDLFGVPASAVNILIDSRSQNLAVVNQSGLDFDLGYRREVARGSFAAGLAGTRLFTFRQKITGEAPAAELLGTLGNPAKLRLRGRLLWSNDSFGAAAFVNHIAGYENRALAAPEPVSAWTTLDLQLSVNVRVADARRFRIALSASNLFDSDPPYVTNFNGLNAVGYDPENANPVGRLLSVQATASW
jgi:outer membrane receptor protein involved in Fe transport